MANLTLLAPPSTDRDVPNRQSVQPQAIRVLHVINGELYAGAERVQDLLASRLGKHGFEVGLACLKPDRFPRMREACDVPLYRLPMRGKFDLRAVWGLVRIIRRHGYRLLHAHSPRAAMVAGTASVLTGVPLVCHVHSSESRDPGLRWQNAVNSLVERFGFRRSAAVIAVSGSLGELLAERGVGEKLTVVRNGVPCRRESSRRASDRGRPDRPTPGEPLVLGTVALYRPRKGLEVFLQALAMLRARGHAIHWRAVGRFETPEYEQQIKGLVDQLGLTGIVQFVGFTRDVDAELDQIDLLVLPSTCREGLPMSVIEAMAAGVPVVGSRIEGIVDAVRDGRDGLLCEPNDPHDLAAAIERFATGGVDWPAMRANARSRQAESFSGRSMAAGVAEVYRRIFAATDLAAG